MDEIKLRYFISAARHLSFTKAAEDCNVSQSTISKQILALENELGSQLFVRMYNSLKLTASGELLAMKAEDYMEQYRMINESVRRLHLTQEKRLTIGVGPWEWALLVEPLKIFSKLRPDVEIYCSQYTYQRMNSHLRSGTIDVGICSDVTVKNIIDIQFVPLGSSSFNIAASKSHPFWEMSDKDRALLKDQTVITFYENDFEIIRPYCIKNNMKHRGFTHSNFFSTYISMLRAELGISLIPRFVKDYIYPEVAFEELSNPPLSQVFCVARKPSSTINEAVEMFIDICCDYYKDLEDLAFAKN